MTRAPLLALLFVAAPLFAGAPYDVDLGASVDRGSLTVQPVASGPAGKVLRYEMSVRRESGAGASSSSQSGTVKLGRDGRAPLASSSVSVSPGERYRVSVRLLDHGRPVAEDTASLP